MISYRTKMVLKIIGLFAGVTLLGIIMFSIILKGGPKIQKPEPTTPSGQIPIANFPTSGAFTGETNAPTAPGVGELPASPIANGGPTLTVQLTSAPIVAPTIIDGGNIAFYDSRDGKFYTIDGEGNIVAMSDASFPKAESIVFADTADIAAIEFPDGSNVIYDFTTQQQTTLPSHWEDFGFTSDGEQITAKSIGTSPENNALIISESNGSRTRAIAGMGNNSDEVTVNWSPNNSAVAFSETGRAQSVFGREEVYIIDQNGEASGSLIVDGSTFSAIWSPDGAHIIYSVANINNYNAPLLSFVKATGTNVGNDKRNIPLETWAEKCTFKDAITVYCGVPQEIPLGARYGSKLITTGDDLYSINVVNGVIRLVGTPAAGQQMNNLRVSDDNKTIFFTDKFGRLNSMRLQ